MKVELKEKGEFMDFFQKLLFFEEFSRRDIDDLKSMLFRWFVLLSGREGTERMVKIYVSVTKNYMEQLFNLVSKTRSLLKSKGGEMK
ncbi:MAG: hypothetical protein ACTSSA_06785 [Candidatus Freyarchaeota archaeon]